MKKQGKVNDNSNINQYHILSVLLERIYFMRIAMKSISIVSANFSVQTGTILHCKVAGFHLFTKD